MVRRSSLAAAAAAMAVLPAPAGHAVTATAYSSLCLGSVTWSFSPPLGTTPGSGDVTQTFSGICGLGVAGVTTTPPDAGEFHSFFGFGPVVDLGGYSGDCVLAIVTVNGTSHVLVNGSIAVEQRLTPLGSAHAGANVMTPNAPCNVSTATGDRVVSDTAAGVFG